LQQSNLDMLDTLHRRVGDDLNVMQNDDRLWARMFGSDSIQQRLDNPTLPEAEGSNWGFQIGVDLYQSKEDDGKRTDAGFYLGRLDAKSDITGMTGASPTPAWMGTLRPQSTLLGLYWTHKTASQWYFDLVGQGSWFSGDARAVTGISAPIDGSGLLGSIELGYSHALNEHWTLQPQAQFVAQRNTIDDIAIPNATVSFDSDIAKTGRLGLRLVGDYTSDAGRQWKPYLRANLWHGFDGTQTMLFTNDAASTPIATQLGYDSGELGAGFTLALNDKVNLYGEIDHLFALGGGAGELSKGISGAIGIRVLFGNKAAPPPPLPPPSPPPPPPPPAPPQPVTLRLSADALFDFDSAQLRNEGRQSLDVLVEGLRNLQYQVLIVGGHTDRLGAEAYNQALSERRANSVRDYLVQSGIPANDVRATGYGESRPITTAQQCQGDSSPTLIACLQPDRRVEVEVSATREP
jgi:outer membrane autotransporter protein